MNHTPSRILSCVVLALTVILAGCGGSNNAPAGGSGTNVPEQKATAGVSRIEQLGVSDNLDAYYDLTAGTPDPAHFSTAFPSKFEKTFLSLKNGAKLGGLTGLVKLSAPPAGEVRSLWLSGEWKYKGVVIGRSVVSTREGGWAHFRLAAAEDFYKSIPGGEYEFTVGIVGAESRSVKVMVKSSAGTPPKLEVVTTKSYSIPDGLKLADVELTSFKPNDAAVVFATSAAKDAAVSWAGVIYKFQGKAYGWDLAPLKADGKFTYLGSTAPQMGPGDYEAEVTMLASGEKKALKFSFQTDATGATQAQSGAIKFDERANAAQTYATSFDAWDDVRPHLLFPATGAPPARASFAFEIILSHKSTDVARYSGQIRTPVGITTGRLDEERPIPAGPYQITVINVLTGERTMKDFTFTSDGKLPPTPTLVPRPAATATRTP